VFVRDGVVVRDGSFARVCMCAHVRVSLWPCCSVLWIAPRHEHSYKRMSSTVLCLERWYVRVDCLARTSCLETLLLLAAAAACYCLLLLTHDTCRSLLLQDARDKSKSALIMVKAERDVLQEVSFCRVRTSSIPPLPRPKLLAIANWLAL